MLTDKAIQKLKPRERLYRVVDGSGLCIEITPGGSRLWRFRYRVDGAARMLALGSYPEICLAAAREAMRSHRTVLLTGVDPSAKRRRDKVIKEFAAATTFEAVTREWLGKQGKLAPVTLSKATWMLETMAFPMIGPRAIAEIDAPEVLAVLRRVEMRGKLETAQRLKQRIGQVMRYAVATGRAARDPTTDLRGAIESPRAKHYGAVTDPKAVGALLRAIDSYNGHVVTACALQLSPLLFVRPGELRGATWDEMDLESAEWRIPGSRMKMREVHIVPLSTQAVAIFRELQAITGSGRLVFPSVRTADRPMSENTVTGALRRLGYTGKDMTAHGFRALASTRLNELGYPVDHIERQLAHAERNKVRAAYNRAQYLDERRRMMQSWADYLDGLRHL
ncbi:MAG: tyrosine-type recombinase/integrase [Dokdonella sp.]